MAIEFNCPHCAHAYRLKDEYAGKPATCKRCREKIVIPQPVTIPDDAPAKLSAEELAAKEAEAQAALADEQTKVEQDEASRVIQVECKHCDHKWIEPLERAGKNTVCPECRQRVKIPVPEDVNSQDWRIKNTKLPSMAKQHAEKMEGVQDAGDATMVTGGSLREAGADGVEYEPRPLKQKIMFVLVPLLVLAGSTFGIRSCYYGRIEGKEHRLIQDSQEEFAKSTGALAPGDAPPETPLLSAILYIAGGEHAVRHNDPKNLKEAQEQFAKARDAVRKAPAGHARNAVGGELAVAMLTLGGTEQEARDQLRIRWYPDTNIKARVNERVYTVLEELRQTLSLVQGADFEFKNHLARRLTRELAKRGQALLAVELIPLALFGQTEQDEAKALVALEVYRADKDKTSDLPVKTAADLKTRGAELAKSVPTPASAQTLFLALDTPQAPRVVAEPKADPVSDAVRLAFVGKLLMDNKSDAAIKLALRPGGLDGRVRALVLCADWSADPTAALDAASGLLPAIKGQKEISPYSVLRLAQIAAEKGKLDQAKTFADAVADEGLKAWAKGSIVHMRVAAMSKDKAEEAWAEPPPDKLKEFRAGHAWGWLWVARQNTRASGDRSGEVKAVSAWPLSVIPFGKAGVALGLQDK